jgi:hypothetical protein
MFDIQATIKWVSAVLTDPEGAAAEYKELGAPWTQSFVQIVLPVYVIAFAVGAVVSMITGGSFLYAGFTVGLFVFSLIWTMAWTLVIAFILDYVAGVFDAERNYDRVYALVALAIVPAALGNAVGALPWLGWLLSLGLGIYSLMLAYRFVPVFIDGLPEASRVKHFVVSIIAAIVVNVVVSMMLGAMFAPALMSSATFNDRAGAVSNTGVGLFGGVGRQAEIADAAAMDQFDPPADGMLNDAQVRAYADALKKTTDLRERLSKSFEKLDEKEGEPSISDVFSGANDAMRMSTAEMEVVKSAGGNWAEHQWVRGQIEVARIQQDLNATTQNNYDLFLKYQSEIEQYD